MGKRIGIVGTRYGEFEAHLWDEKLREILDGLPDDVEIIVNGAPGTDRRAMEIAHERGLKVTVLFPDEAWSQSARYFIHRNAAVVEQADEVYAVWDGRSAGTLHAITLARHRKVPIHIVRVRTENWQRPG